MQLDQTHVTIRARTLTEISDLAMVMIRSYPTAIIIGFAMGALPWAILNALLLGMIPINEFQVGAFDEDMYSSLAAYQILMAILVFAQDLVPGRIGMIAGIFFGLSFGFGGIAAAALGVLADVRGIEYVYQVCAWLPALGLLTILLPKRREMMGAY